MDLIAVDEGKLMGLDKWGHVLENGRTVPWLSSQIQQLFSIDSTASLLEVLFSSKHANYIRQLLSGAMRIELHPVNCISRYLLENDVTQRRPGVTPPLMRSMIMMLVARLLFEQETPENDISIEKQRIAENQCYLIATTTEQLLFSQLFHSTIMDINSINTKGLMSQSKGDLSLRNETQIEKMLHQGNKLATLIGDLLITKTYSQLGVIKYSQVAEIFSNALAEYAENMIMANETASTNMDTTGFQKVAYSGVSQLTGKAFRCLAIITGRGNDIQRLVEELGTLIGQIIQEHVLDEVMGRKIQTPGNDDDNGGFMEIQVLKTQAIELISQIRGNSQVAKSLVTIIETI